MSDNQFWKYLNAYTEKVQIENQYQAERWEIYDGISPTITGYDYDSGRIYKLGSDPEEYAIHLHEIFQKRNRRLKETDERVDVLEEAASLLYDDEQAHFEVFKQNPYKFPYEIIDALRECVMYVLERDQIEEGPDEMSASEWDAAIEAMEEEELLEDYFDKDGTFDNSIRKPNEREKQFGKVELSEWAKVHLAEKYPSEQAKYLSKRKKRSS